MKKLLKIVAVAAVFLFLEFPVFAKDSFSTAGFWKSDSERSGGSFEIGFPDLFDNQKFFVRENLEIGGAGLFVMEEPCGVTFLDNKLAFGGKYESGDLKIKSYGFFVTGVNLNFLDSAKLSMNTGFDFAGGGGFELGFKEIKSAFVIEYGGGWCFIPENLWGKNQSVKSFGYNSLTLGFRQYF